MDSLLIFLAGLALGAYNAESIRRIAPVLESNAQKNGVAHESDL